MLADLQKALDQRQADGLLRQRRLLDSPVRKHASGIAFFNGLYG